MGDPFYITTAISYPNGPPHIGHAYEAIAADVIARFQRSQGRDVRFPDRYGRAWAEDGPGGAGRRRRAAGICRQNVASFPRDVRQILMFRTIALSARPKPDHYRASQAIWTAMEERGDLYLDRYEGWYSVRDEAYYETEELTTAEDGTKLSPQGTPVEWTVEESWFFRLVQIPAAVARPLRRKSGLHPAGEPPQRGRTLRRRRPEGPQHLAHQLRLGRAACRAATIT